MDFDFAKFVFWTAIETLGLIFLGLLAAKAIAAVRAPNLRSGSDRLVAIRTALYLVVLGLVILGARFVGNNIAAENYFRASMRDLRAHKVANAYLNATRAVDLRPDELRYWQGLEVAKLAEAQFASLVADRPVFLSLGKGKLEEEDGYRFALCYYYLGQYDKVLSLTQAMTRENRTFAAPHVLEGYTYLAQKRYAEAQQVFLAVLQSFPTHQAAVEGLAHAHFLSGNRTAALAVLNETARFPFPPEARRRIDALKSLYAQ